jgi:hypothetical protein
MQTLALSVNAEIRSRVTYSVLLPKLAPEEIEAFLLREHPDILVKDCFWRDPLNQCAGNTIDFFVVVLGMSFAEAMNAILSHP